MGWARRLGSTAVILAQHVAQRLDETAMLPTLQTALVVLATQDAPVNTGASSWKHIIPQIYALLSDGDEATIRPFTHAWMLLVAAMRRLDHLQDGDVPDHVLPTTDQHGAQYNLLFSYYLLATALLDELDTQHIAPHRILRLRRMWANVMLCAASGQQYDLELKFCAQPYTASFDDYQRIAQAKSGGVFAIAFGGAAILATDDPAVISTCTFAGQVYGMLVQFCDDMDDALTQPNCGINLVRVYDALCVEHNIARYPHDVNAYWKHIHTAYQTQVDHALTALSAPLRAGLQHLFAMAFESQQACDG